MQRRRCRTALAIGIAVAPLALGATASVFLTEQSTQSNRSALPTGAISVDVVRIIDGDTLDVRSAETIIRMQLYGIDAPEQGDPCYEHAARRLGQLADTRVSLLADERLTDRFDRDLRYMYGIDGQSIEATMVREGLARAWREDGSQRPAARGAGGTGTRGAARLPVGAVTADRPCPVRPAAASFDEPRMNGHGL